MPELTILISAVACAGSAVFLYFNRSSAAAAGIAVLSFIACLYGVGQLVQRDNVAVTSWGSSTAPDWRPAQDTSINDSERRKQIQAEADARDKARKVEAPPPVRRQPEVARDNSPKNLPLSPPNQLSAIAPSSATVIISNFTSNMTSTKYLEISGRVVNTNEFPIKNIVLKCGDISYASSDVSTVIDKVVPAKSEIYLAKVRMGPIKSGMPPTTCLVAMFDRAD
jgi:hypothetical protein